MVMITKKVGKYWGYVSKILECMITDRDTNGSNVNN